MAARICFFRRDPCLDPIHRRHRWHSASRLAGVSSISFGDLAAVHILSILNGLSAERAGGSKSPVGTIWVAPVGLDLAADYAASACSRDDVCALRQNSGAWVA